MAAKLHVLESDLRKRLKDEKAFPYPSVIWTEPKLGVPEGQPDCFIQLLGQGGYWPFELKRGNTLDAALAALRPSQRRYAKLAARRGFRPRIMTVTEQLEVMVGEVSDSLLIQKALTIDIQSLTWASLSRLLSD